MRSLIAAVLLSVLGGALAGCAQTARVVITTDSNGKMDRVDVVRSTGNDKLDATAKAAAIKNFRKEVRVPRKNGHYIQPVVFMPKPAAPLSE